ncbi:SsgA family sporulation/cell division regulator [Kitasatospora sp. NPDC093806]|uniref:SsgA family sporulation/cell division regulator n=1 Tax=Kitasatospora sp. NPDC093806 TaxID=3155075 RepID=UPI0034291D62
MTYETPRVPVPRAAGDGCAIALDLRVVVCPGLTVSVPARLRYRTADPYAVFLDNHTDLATPITWVFARELLAAGLHRRAGLGSVSVHPGADGRAGADGSAEVVFITLTGEGSSVVLRAPADRVRTFLARTEHLVPRGSERTHLDLDGLLRRLRDGGAASPGP